MSPGSRRALFQRGEGDADILGAGAQSALKSWLTVGTGGPWRVVESSPTSLLPSKKSKDHGDCAPGWSWLVSTKLAVHVQHYKAVWRAVSRPCFAIAVGKKYVTVE